MKPQTSPSEDPQGDLFRSELQQILDAGHRLVKLSHEVNWERFDDALGATCHRGDTPSLAKGSQQLRGHQKDEHLEQEDQYVRLVQVMHVLSAGEGRVAA
jgi:hypothetical protein